MNNKIFYIIPFLIFFSCCEYSLKHPGYNKKGNVYYQLLEIGENDKNADYGDIITVHLAYKTMNDSLYFEGSRRFQLNKPSFEGSIEQCFSMLSEGDYARFILSTEKFYNQTLKTSIPEFLKNSDEMIVEIKMQEIQNQNEYKKEKEAFLRWIEDFGKYEKVLLKQFIEEKKIAIKPTRSGLYYIVLKKGDGKKVEKGDTIIFHYEGRFLNGKFFDSSRQRKEPFGFVYGQEWQVIKGLEEGLGMMREGEKALFILPSELAFGETGSSTGIIPPYTSLIFEVDMLEVK